MSTQKMKTNDNNINSTIDDIKTGMDILIKLQPMHINNTDELLYCLNNKRNLIMMLHQTKIYYFKINMNSINEYSNDYYIKNCEILTQLFIRMFTMRKYRLLKTLNLLLFIFDNSTLAALALSLFFPEFNDSKSISIIDSLSKFTSVFIVSIIEIMFDVIHHHFRIWIMHRLYLYMVITMQILYIISLSIDKAWQYRVISVLYYIRLGIAILNYLIKHAMDIEIDYDLTYNLNVHDLQLLKILGNIQCHTKKHCHKKSKKKRKKNNETTEIKELVIKKRIHEINLKNWEYKGCESAFTPYNVFRISPKKSKYNEKYLCHRWIIYVVLFTIIFMPPWIGLIMIIFIILWTFILWIFTKLYHCICYGKCRDKWIIQDTILGECLRNSVF